MGMSVTEEILEGGKHWSMRINRGMCLQLSDLEGAGCVGMIAFNAMDPLEKNPCDTSSHNKDGRGSIRPYAPTRIFGTGI